jgi:LmbE family N-acetylglucosaminyl deacetylase
MQTKCGVGTLLRGNRGRKLGPRVWGLAVLLLVAGARAQDSVTAVTDAASYNAGSEVRLKVLFSSTHRLAATPLDISAFIHYAGESQPLSEQGMPLVTNFVPRESGGSTGYQSLWKTPFDARAGRYEVDLVGKDPKTHDVVLNAPGVASFAVYRKLLRIDRVELDKTFYVSGDPVACQVTIANVADRPLRDLRVEFSDRYWPWIAQTSERAGVEVVTLAQGVSLAPGKKLELQSARAAIAQEVKESEVHQYAVVAWDRDRKNIFDIAFSPLVFIHPPGSNSRSPYPLQYVYPNLDAVNASSYRHFYPPALDSPAIEFDRSHTMFAARSEATLKFSILNPADKPWKGVMVRAHLLSSEGRDLGNHTVAEGLDLAPHNPPLKEETKFSLPGQESGVFRVRIELSDSSGLMLAENNLEWGVNPLPKSVLVFCAHPDDEMAHAGIIRAAVENHLPIHVVYFTSGDAGSCDRYYQHSCRPEEALNFGNLRMEEARRALGHLGVPREEIYFLGLPDGGSGQIWYNHIEPTNPYLSVLLASDHAPYEGIARPNLPYARDSVVEAAKKLIWKFQPEVIYTGHPDERHVDHRTNNWFVVKAMQELLREGIILPKLTLLTDQVYGPGPQAHAPYQYRKNVLNVSGDVMALAQEAGWYYQSQDGNRALGRLRTFEQLPRSQVHWEVLDWKDHEGWNEKP